MKWSNLRWMGIWVFLSSLCVAELSVPKGCQIDKECIRELPGLLCADGTPSYYTVIPRRNAENVLIFLYGGGACWDWSTCSGGLALTLTRRLPHTDWNFGEGIFNQRDLKNPFRDFTVVTVPYCTGDVFIGDSKINYGDDLFPYILEHRGYNNAFLTIQAASSLFSDAKQVVLMGTSAGGIGAFTHMRNLNQFFPRSEKFVISDAGTPFQPPFVSESTYRKVLENWNAYKGFPVDNLNRPLPNFGAVLEYNRKTFPQIKFGLIHSYSDYVMSGFSYGLGAPDFSLAVRDTLIQAANEQIGLDTPHQKVFYLETWGHTFTNYSLKATKSMGVTLSSWLEGMIHQGTWENIRPDLEKEIWPWNPMGYEGYSPDLEVR